MSNKDKKDIKIFVVLLLLALIPVDLSKIFPETYFFGWLPIQLLYWWILIAINFIFILRLVKRKIKEAEQKQN